MAVLLMGELLQVASRYKYGHVGNTTHNVKCKETLDSLVLDAKLLAIATFGERHSTDNGLCDGLGSLVDLCQYLLDMGYDLVGEGTLFNNNH